MLKLRKIAVTGNIASGKSSVCDLLKRKGAFLVNTDSISHDLLVSDSDCMSALIALLGQEIVINHQIDRKKVATLVFSNHKKLDELEKILHPLIFKRIEDSYKQAREAKIYTMFVVEIPLLFECCWDSYFDLIITVAAEKELRKQRFKQKGYSEEDFELREKRFMSEEIKIRKSDFVIYNNESQKDMAIQVDQILKFLTP